MSEGGAARLVVVTGGRSGIGAACVERFGRDGDDVVTADIIDPWRPLDVTDQEAVAAFFDELPRAPDVLVNAAGIGDGAPVIELSSRAWRRVMGVNLDGAFYCLQAAARRMAEARSGSIINVSSINDRWPLRTAAAYCASKAALSMLTKVAAIELGSSNVRVNAVAPGPIDTPLIAAALQNPAVAAAMEERTPLGGRVGTAEEVADVVAFLASDDARWITGHVVVVDGGQLLLGEPDIAALLARSPTP